MPPMIVVAAVGAVVLLVIVLLVLRSKGKSEPEAPRFEPPRELAPQKPKEPPPAQSAAPMPPPATSTAPAPPSGQFPLPSPPAPSAAPEPPPAQISAPPAPPPQIKTPPVAIPTPLAATPEPEPPPAPEPPAEEEQGFMPEEPATTPKQESTAAMAAPPVAPPPKPAPPPPPAKPRTPLRSYSSINDESASEPAEAKVDVKPPPPKPAPPAPVAPKVSEPKVPAAEAKPQVSTGKMAPAAAPVAEHDFSALNESKPKLPAAEPVKPAPEPAKPAPAPVAETKPAATGAAAAIAAKYMQPSNPATAELEKNDPRHAAARRLARLSVSEIKLYHEAEVTSGRENKDLWTRLQTDIGLARQTFEARVVAEVRDRFDYLLDEIIRQLAEGDASKLGAGAPELKTEGGGAAAAAPPKAEAPKPAPEAPKSAPKAEAPKAEAPKAASVPAAEPAKPAGPTGVAARGLPSNPETAELEKSDPRHAAARRLARLSVSEIKLYHEAEVTAGRENKDLWTRLQQDISLATQTFEKRVDLEVRNRFDYLYDEVLRQLAEGDAAKLGPGAPAPKKAAEAPAPPAAAAAPAPTPAAPAAAPAATGAAAKYMQPSNPATAELEKSDPRHAAARRLARLSVSEIKLYHEAEVTAGREAKDLWTRMGTDIGLATQTFEKRVDKEVRERFDYLYDEILRQLAEGDATKLGPNAPKPNQ